MNGLFKRLQDEIDAQQEQRGLSPVDLLDLPPALAGIIKKIVRRNGMALAQIAQELQQAPAEIQEMLDQLVEKGFLRRIEVKDETWYKAQFGRKRDPATTVDVWSALGNLIEDDDPEASD